MLFHDGSGEGFVGVDDGSNDPSDIDSVARQPKIVDTAVTVDIAQVTVERQAPGLGSRIIASHFRLNPSPAPTILPKTTSLNNSGRITRKAAIFCLYYVGM